MSADREAVEKALEGSDECCEGDLAKCPVAPMLRATFPLIVESSVSSTAATTSTTAALQALEKEVKEYRDKIPTCPCPELREISATLGEVKVSVDSVAKKRSLFAYLFQEGSGPAILKMLVPLIIGAGGILGLQECKTMVVPFAGTPEEAVSSSQSPAGEPSP